MKKGLTEIVFILDRSGSMSGLEADTIGGFNSMLQKQKKEEGEAYITTILFDDKIEMIHDRAGLAEVKPLTEEEYYVRGCTALLDAVGTAVQHIETVHKYAREEDRPEKTIFIITTDGQENASKEYSYSAVKKLVEQKREKGGWEFIFLGANIDAIAEAGRFGINASRAVNYVCDRAGTKLNFGVLDKTISKMRACPTASAMSEMMDEGECFAEIRADYKKRKGAK